MVVSLSSGVFGTYNGLISTLVYSVVHDSEGISATLEEASWIGRLIYLLSSKLNHLTIVFFNEVVCILNQTFSIQFSSDIQEVHKDLPKSKKYQLPLQ